MQIPVQITEKGTNILGMLHVPEKQAENSPIVIMCYGFDGHRVDQHRVSVQAAREAESIGINFFRFDFRGVGISDGEFWETSIKSRIQDIICVIDYLNGCFYNTQHKFFLIGFSDGSLIASEASKYRNDISGLIMWSPTFVQNKKFFKFRSAPKFAREPVTKKIVAPYGGLWIGMDYLKENKEISPLESFNQFKSPKLCIFGGEDPISSPTKNFLIDNGFDKNNNMKIETIENAKHVFGRSDWKGSLIQNTFNWIFEHCN